MQCTHLSIYQNTGIILPLQKLGMIVSHTVIIMHPHSNNYASHSNNYVPTQYYSMPHTVIIMPNTQ